jgi:eukaryotic-like serine/threonine-protein kinase
MSVNFDPHLWRRADAILDELLDHPPAERLRHLNRMNLERDVQQRVERLLRAVERPGLLDAGHVALAGLVTGPAEPSLEGREFGPYRLESLIGRGGMSAVYRARRTDDCFDEPVAVKVMSSALLASDWQERFRREARFLAQLRHPGIATLLDAGVADDGTPYLVTELVEGQPIDQHSRNAGLDIRERVRLMVELCDIVAFAQKRLFVHRDIKPENVLVTSGGRVKLMDFGIARQVADDGIEQATMTRIFTPGYAAPEQLAGASVSTATDVFSLGALLYQLLTGAPPFSDVPGTRITGTPIVPPSRRTATREDLSAGQRTRHARLLHGDLDNITRKALDDLPERRYANAATMGEDLRAWLEHRPVSARAPGLGYLTRLFARRHPAFTGAMAALLLVGTAGISATLWQAKEAREQAAQAVSESRRAQAVNDFLVHLFEATGPENARGSIPTALDLLDTGAHQIELAFSDTPALQVELMILVGDLYRQIEKLDQSQALLDRAVELAGNLGEKELHALALHKKGYLELVRARHAPALEALEASERLLDQAGLIPGTRHGALMQQLTMTLSQLGRADEAMERAEHALTRARAIPDMEPAALFDYLWSLGNALMGTGQFERAEPLLHEAMALDFDTARAMTRLGPVHSNLAIMLSRKGDLEGALHHARTSVEITEQTHPPGHYIRARRYNNLGAAYGRVGRYEEAADAILRALEILEMRHPDGRHPSLASTYNNLATNLGGFERHAEAEPYQRLARDLSLELFGDRDLRHAIATANLGYLLIMLDRYDEAEQLLNEALDIRQEALGEDHHAVGATLAWMAKLCLAQGQADQSLRLADEALDLYRQTGWEKPDDLIEALRHRALALIALGRHHEAGITYTEALKRSEQAGFNAGRAALKLLADHAEFLVGQNDPDAPLIAVQSLNAHQQFHGRNHPATVRMQALVDRTQEWSH